jgi:hypothetical protein
VITILVWGFGAWELDEKLHQKLATWNACMLCKATSTVPEDYAKAISAQMHTLDFDMVAKLKALRLPWLEDVMRISETSMLRRVVLRYGTSDLLEGTIFDDALEHASLEESSSRVGLAWWGKEGPPFYRLRPGGGKEASRHGPAANYEACAERHAEAKALAARATAALGDGVVAARAAAVVGAADRWWKGVAAEPPSKQALRLTWWAWRGALLKMLCVMM